MANGYSGTVFATGTVDDVAVRFPGVNIPALPVGDTAVAFMPELPKMLFVASVIRSIGEIGGLVAGNTFGGTVNWLLDPPLGGGRVMLGPSEQGKVGQAKLYLTQLVPLNFNPHIVPLLFP